MTPSLTPKEQRAILDGNYPALIGMDRFDVGQVVEITSRVSVRIEKRNLKRGKVTWDYTVIDNRDRVLRFRPPARGKQVPAEKLSATEIQKASEQSAYDGNPRDPMDAGFVVPLEFQNRLALDARTRRAQEDERTQEQSKAQLRSLNQELRDRIRRGEDLSQPLARIARALRNEDAA